MDILTTIAARPVSPFTDTLTKKLNKLLKSRKHIARLTSDEFVEMYAQTSGVGLTGGWVVYNNRQIMFSCNYNNRCVVWK